MVWKGGSIALALALLAAAQLATTPAVAASRQQAPGILGFRVPLSAGDEAVIRWGWTPGSQVGRASFVGIQMLVGGKWVSIARGLGIEDETFTWKTRDLNPGAVQRRVIRGFIQGTTVRSREYAIYVDHVAPVVSISEPNAFLVGMGGPSASGADIAIVRGETSLRTLISDVPLKAGFSVTWRIGNAFVVTTSPRFTSDFSHPPGWYEVTAIATDRAGNEGVSETLQVLGLPDMPP